jgi:hypothetical protein
MDGKSIIKWSILSLVAIFLILAAVGAGREVALEWKESADDFNNPNKLQTSASSDVVLVSGPLWADGDVFSNFSYGGTMEQWCAINLTHIGDQFTDEYYIWFSTAREGVWNFENKSFSNVFAANFTKVTFNIMTKPSSSGVTTVNFTINNETVAGFIPPFVENELYDYYTVDVDYDIPVSDYNSTQFGLHGVNSISNNNKIGAFWIELSANVSEVEIIDYIITSIIDEETKTKRIRLPPGFQEFWEAYGIVIISAIVGFLGAIGELTRRYYIEKRNTPTVTESIKKFFEKR